MFWGNLIGVIVGVGFGLSAGRAGGPLGLLDGGLAGLMGGMMGAMLAVMLLYDTLYLAITAALLLGVHTLFMLLLAYAVEAAACRQNDARQAVTLRPWSPLGHLGLRLVGTAAGIATIDALIGGLVGLLGDSLLIVLTEHLVLTNTLVGALLLVVGLALLRVPAIVRSLALYWPHAEVPMRPITGPGSAFLFGLPFGLTTCPACTPMLLPIVGAAMLTGNPAFSALLLFVFGVARGLPLVLVGVFTTAFARLEALSRLVPALERLGGASLVVAAGFFLFQAARLVLG
ncbi:MAG: sulfite exporter TauE/SafE family protein [Chloroflexi bacterium]|nr:sulfite exporter TauE/SafE family protein [Chloroflexota bacterium]